MYRDVDVREAYAAPGMQKTADGGTAGAETEKRRYRQNLTG